MDKVSRSVLESYSSVVDWLSGIDLSDCDRGLLGRLEFSCIRSTRNICDLFENLVFIQIVKYESIKTLSSESRDQVK